MADKIWKDSDASIGEKGIEQERNITVNSQTRNEANDFPPSRIASWEVCKENIQPIPQGRNIEALMESLSLVHCISTRQDLIRVRRKKFEQDLKENSEDLSKQLDLWYSYIDWLEQHIPDGGKVSGITEAIEKCIEFYYDKKAFKQDDRLFNIFMKFKRFCDEPIEIFSFMYANSICTLLARLYVEWSWQYENRKNLSRAENLIKLGIKNLASPRELLLQTEAQLKYRIDRMIRAGELIETNSDSSSNSTRKRETQNELANGGIRAALQTLKFRVTKGKSIKVPINRVGIRAVEQTNVGGLKSQTKIVNGVRVPKTMPRSNSAAATTSTVMRAPSAVTTITTPGGGISERVGTLKPSTSNKPIEVFKDKKRATDTENINDVGLPNDENSPTEMRNNNNILANIIMPKIPTSQRIHLVGRSGQENHIPRSKTMSVRSRIE